MTHIHFNWRLASRFSVVTMAILVVLVIALVQHNATVATQQTGQNANTNTTSSATQGVDLGGTPAPNFTLTDQTGQKISLSQFRGKAVVLTFMYTHCPDVCPLTAEHLHTTMQQLGSQAKDVAVVAVSTDPKRDDQAAALNFTKAHNMQDYWHYLIGSNKELSAVWSGYNIYAQAQQNNVNHSMAVYVIDQQGKERTYFDTSFTPQQLTDTLKQLLNK
jgi:protein SCO1